MAAFPEVLTLEAAAERLLTTVEKLRVEVEAGRLKTFTIDGELRTTDTFLLEFMGVSHSSSISERATEMSIVATAPAQTDPASLLAGKEWSPENPFSYRWPEGPERYEEAYQTRVTVGDRETPILIGFCTRESAGDKDRRRAVVFMGHQPSLNALVEFSGENSDVFPTTGRMASVIKLPSGKHLRPGDPIPPEYANFPLDTYNNIVRGPYAAASMAVVVQKDDFTLMAHHGLLRARDRERAIPRLTVYGEVIKTVGRDIGIRIENEAEARAFWQKHGIETSLDWFGPGAPVFSIGRQRDIASCQLGDRASLTVEIADRPGKRGTKTVAFSVL